MLVKVNFGVSIMTPKMAQVCGLTSQGVSSDVCLQV